MRQTLPIHRFFTTILFLAVTTLTWAYDFAVDGIYYDKNTDGTSVTVTYKTSSDRGYSGSVVIPSTVTYSGKTYSVTSIGDIAFEDCSDLTSVTIPNSVTSIGWQAFEGCSGLTSVTIPESVTSIGFGAFEKCTGLTSVTLNSNSIVSKTSFSYSNNFKTIFGSQVKEYILGDNVTAIGDNAFRECSGLTSFTIPESVTSIGERAFYNCTGLTKAEFASIESLCNITFSDSYSNPLYYAKHLYINGQEVTDVVIPNSVTSINDYAFYNCSGLTKVTIPESVTSISDIAFEYCSDLTSVTLNSNDVVSKTSYTFCITGIFGYQVKEYILGDNITTIGSYAFRYAGLTSVTIPNSVTTIGSNAFDGCTDLTSVTIPESVTSIGERAFYNCTGLTKAEFASIESLCNITFSDSYSNPLYYAKHLYINGQEVIDVVIPNSITSINAYTFYNCSGLTSVTIPESVTSIGSAFEGCTGLTKAEFASIESLCKIDFYSYDSNPLSYAKHLYINGQEVTGVVIPNSITSINDYTFRNCSSLKSVTIPESVTSIGEGAFSDCTGLTSVTIPESVTSIGRDAFSGCSGLTKAEFASIESQCKIKFSDSSSNPLYYAKHLYINGHEVTDVVIPNSITSINDLAFCGCTGMTSLTIPNSVTNIGHAAFSGCQLQTIINHCDNDIAKDVFSDRVYLHTQLYVPDGTVWDYIFNTKWGEFLHIKEFATSADDIRNDAVYMIADRSGRNFPVYDKSAKTLKKVSYTLNLDDSDTGACWQVIRNGSDTYLYNIGAGMYAAYDADDDLSLSIVPTALAIDMTEDGATIDGKPVMLVANKSVTPIDNPTGIDTLQADEAADTAIYDLNGRRLHEKPARGFYIQGGKKYYGK